MSKVAPGTSSGRITLTMPNEEWVIVLRGEPTLRTPEGEHVLKEGDVTSFPRGKDGAHQIINHTDSPVRVLMLSSMVGPDYRRLHRFRQGSTSTDSHGEADHVFPHRDPPSTTGRARTSSGRRSRLSGRPREIGAHRSR